MFSNAVNHYRTHLSSDPDFYKVIDSLSFDDSFWGYDTLDPSSAANYNTDPRIFDYATGNNYEVGGNYMDIYNRKSIVRTIKGELTNQYNKAHQFKVGAEYRTTDITYNNITILQADYTDGDPVVRAPENNEIHNSFQSMNNPFTGNPIDGRHLTLIHI